MRVAKEVGAAIGAPLLRHIAGQVVEVERMGKVDPTWYTSGTKRKLVRDSARARAGELELDVSTSLLNLGIEYVHTAINKLGNAVEAVGDEADDGVPDREAIEVELLGDEVEPPVDV